MYAKDYYPPFTLGKQSNMVSIDLYIKEPSQA